MGDAIAPVALLCATWNVGAALPQDPLAPWLKVKNDSSAMPQIYAIALQEVVELNTFNVVGPNRSSYAWETRIQDELRASYTLIANEQRVGLLLLVYVHSSILPWVSRVQSSNRAVGVLGIAGNKAGVAIRFRLYDTSMCFVAAHFTAHTEKVVSRNADFHTIVNAIQFPDPQNMLKPVSIMENDCVFWLGDLNYRLELPLDKLEEVHQLIADHQFDALLKHDQLLTAMQLGKVFEQFREGPITFAPTYKYKPQSRPLAYDKGGKVRMPAWCDRVLYSTPTGNAVVTQQSYGRADMHTSDHVPVMSEFQVVPTKLHSAVNFLGGAFFGGIGWQLVPLLQFFVLTTQLCVNLDSTYYVRPIVKYLAWTTGGSATGLQVLANQLASNALPGAGRANQTYMQVVSSQDALCNSTVGMSRFAYCAQLEPAHLFLVAFFNYLLLLLVLSLLAVLWLIVRSALFRFHKFWRLFRNPQVGWVLLGCVLKVNSLSICVLTAYAVFQLVSGASSLAAVAAVFIVAQLCFLAALAWQGVSEKRYMGALRSASQRMKYGFFFSEYKQEFRLFGLCVLLGEFVSGCALGGLSLAEGTGPPSSSIVQLQLGILGGVQLLLFCALMFKPPFVSVPQFWWTAVVALVKVAMLGGLLVWTNQGMQDDPKYPTVSILLGLGCGLLALLWLVWMCALRGRVWALACQAHCCRSSDFDKAREKREYEEFKSMSELSPAADPERKSGDQSARSPHVDRANMSVAVFPSSSANAPSASSSGQLEMAVFSGMSSPSPPVQFPPEASQSAAPIGQPVFAIHDELLGEDLYG